MKRDDDFLRIMLLQLEASDEHYIFIVTDALEKSTEIKLQEYHIDLACDAGLLVEKQEYLYRLTNDGHDYVQAIREDGIWNRTKEIVAESGGNATLEIVKSLAVGFLKKKISLHTDIDL